MACQGFEMLRQQAQMVVAAASQPVLMQVAQEAAVKDLAAQMGGLQEKLADDPQLQELMSRVIDRIADDVGGPEELQKLFSQLGMFGPVRAAKPRTSPLGIDTAPLSAMAEPTMTVLFITVGGEVSS